MLSQLLLENLTPCVFSIGQYRTDKVHRILLIVVISGMGTAYGAVVGSVIFVFAQNYLQDLLKLVGGEGGWLAQVPVLGPFVSPDRWLLWLGLGFVLCVYHFPSGVVGRLRARGKTDPTA